MQNNKRPSETTTLKVKVKVQPIVQLFEVLTSKGPSPHHFVSGCFIFNQRQTYQAICSFGPICHYCYFDILSYLLRFAMHNVPWALIMAGLLCILLLQGSLRPRWLLSGTLPEKLLCHFLSPNWPFAHYLLSSIDNQDANGLIYHQTVINYNLNRLVVSWRHKFGLYNNYMLLGLMTITSIATIFSHGMR